MYYMPERPLDPPELALFNGHVTFACHLNDATVEVRAYVEDDVLDRDTMQVWYTNTEVSEILSEDQFKCIEEYFDDHYAQIVRFDSDY